MTEQTEWRAGDVVVKESIIDRDWCLLVLPNGERVTLPKAAFPDPQALADFVDSQQPKPRWIVRDSDGGAWEYDIRGPVGSVHSKIVAQCNDPAIAELIATALIARDADEADR
jgi:hypothetical protein